MRWFAGKLARGGAVLAVGSVLLLAGCSQSMMGDKTMSGEEMSTGKKTMKDDGMKAGDTAKDQEMMKDQETK